MLNILRKLAKLKFAKGNAKLKKSTAVFSLPAGHTCPFAMLCQSRAHKVTGKIIDGAHTQFRCYAASAENLFHNIRVSRWRNFELLKACESIDEMAQLINRSLPRRNTKLVRVHSSGDFYSQAYFDAWLKVCRDNPTLTFYCYTKALPFWVNRIKSIPSNFKLVASFGGKSDDLIAKHKLRHARVVFSEVEAKKLGLPIDHDDTHVWDYDGNFALLLHGTQPAGSLASRILYGLRKLGKGGYKADYFDHYKKSGRKRINKKWVTVPANT